MQIYILDMDKKLLKEHFIQCSLTIFKMILKRNKKNKMRFFLTFIFYINILYL